MKEVSPYFAFDAELLLKSNLFDNAISICINGVSQYPLYLSGWLVLIIALKSAGKIDDANLTIDKALTLFPGNLTLLNQKNELSSNFYNITFNNKKNIIYREDEVSDEIVIGPLIELDNDEIIPEDNEQVNIAYNNNLQELAKKLEEVSVPFDDLDEKINQVNTYPKGIITETMANIYISQGAYDEAISSYRNLIAMNPDKKEYYIDKINGLQSKL